MEKTNVCQEPETSYTVAQMPVKGAVTQREDGLFPLSYLLCQQEIKAEPLPILLVAVKEECEEDDCKMLPCLVLVGDELESAVDPKEEIIIDENSWKSEFGLAVPSAGRCQQECEPMDMEPQATEDADLTNSKRGRKKLQATRAGDPKNSKKGHKKSDPRAGISECNSALRTQTEALQVMNSVQYLKKKPFSLHTRKEKIEIKKLGRPTPNLNLQISCKLKNGTRIRKFNVEAYRKKEWLCGCDIVNAFFCFPCLLFGGQKSWTKFGVTDLPHLAEKTRIHGDTITHRNNVLNLAFLDRINVRSQLDSKYRQRIQLHNEQVKNNRYILSLITNCIRFCGAFELALRGHDETEMSSNPGIFRGLINFTTELNDSHKDHFEKAAVFKGSSKSIQNELLDCMVEVYSEEISREIEDAEFVSVITDKTTDVSNLLQMALIYRYTIRDTVVERFWSFLNPEYHNAESLSKCILDQLNIHLKNKPNKLISQSCDGGSVMSGSEASIEARIRQVYPYAYFVHCYIHQLNPVIACAASTNRNAKIFFANIGGISTFFSSSSQRTAILDEVVKRRLVRDAPTRWNFDSRAVTTVMKYRMELIECMTEIVNKDEIKHAPTIDKAGGLLCILQDGAFIFWLRFFHEIMTHVDTLFSELQKTITDPVQIKNEVVRFQSLVQNIRENIAQGCTTFRDKRIREAQEVCDVIMKQAREWFAFTGHLTASNLFVSEKFVQYNQVFPKVHLANTILVYPFLDQKTLETELTVMYQRAEFRSVSGAVPLFAFLVNANLAFCFPETIRLLKIVMTVPMLTSESERCFSTIKRVKTFLQNTMSHDKLSALAMLSIERDFIMSISNFSERVIDKFACIEERKTDFLYKQY